MPVSAVFTFWTLSLTLAVTPGADWAFAIGAGLRSRTVAPAISGLLLGQLAVTLVVAAGVAGALARSPRALAVLTLLGAGYLLWLGIGVLARPPAPHAGTSSDTGSWIRQTIRGAGVSGLNPKVFLLFLALLPRFTDPLAGWPVGVQILLLGCVHIATCAVVYTAVGLGARLVLSTRPAAARVVSRISGVAMIVIGMILIVEQFG